MSNTEPSFTSNEEEIAYSTTPETPTTPKSKSKSKRSPSSTRKKKQASIATNNEQEQVTSPGEEIAYSTTPETPIAPESKSKSKRSSSTAKKSPSTQKKSPSSRQRQPEKKAEETTDKPALAEPQQKEVNALEATTEPKKKVTVTRKRVTASRQKLKEWQEGQASTSEASPVSDLYSPEQETLPASTEPVTEGAINLAPATIEREVEASSSGVEASLLEPEMDTLLAESTVGVIDLAPTTIEREAEVLPEREVEVSPSGPDLDATPVRIKTEDALFEPELEASPFEPDLDPTPVRPKTTAVLSPAEPRPALSIVGPELDTPPADGARNGAHTYIEVEPDVLSLEPEPDATLPRIKAIQISPVKTELDTAGELPSMPGERSDATSVGARFIAPEGWGWANSPAVSESVLTETEPAIPTDAAASAVVDHTEVPAELDSRASAVAAEPAISVDPVAAEPTEVPPEPVKLASTVAAESVIPTDIVAADLTEVPPEPVSGEQDKLPEIIETPPLPIGQPAAPREVERRWLAGKVLALILLVVLTGSSFLLWRDISDTHLYLYALDPASGQTLAQQDLGGGYQGHTSITNPVQTSSSLEFGVQTDQSSSGSKQQLLSLTGNNASWQVESQFPAPLVHGTLSLTPDKRLIVVHADGLQVMTAGGQVLWQMQGDEPTLGTHLFQPAFDGSTLYTVKSAQNGVVAAYDLQSGAVRWTQKLDDTCAYAAPFLLYENMLYIAADHTIYALNSADGTLLWKADRPTRTLLMFAEEHPLLLAAGPQGLAALNALTGATAWSFSGPPPNQASANETLAPAQFYQASIASTNHVIYATGIVWDAQQVREQLWLFAVDAVTGNVRWSERIGSDFISADAGRIYSPLVDTTHGLVILQQAQNDDKQVIAAYDTGDGTQRWSVQLEGVTAAAPSPLQVSSSTLILLDTESSGVTALHSLTLLRMLLVAMIGLSVLLLLLLWMLPFRLWIKRLRSTVYNLPRYLLYPLKLLLRLWRFSHTVFALVLLVIFVWGSVLAYTQLTRSQNYLNQVATSSGNIQWQHSSTPSVQFAMADTQGSIVITNAGDSLHQLTSLGSNGSSQWTSFASEGVFSLPIATTQPGTVLVALSGHTSLHYQFAPDDPAYVHPLDSLYALYLLDRQTGQVIWQSAIVSSETPQDTTVLGTDAKFIYVASRATNSLPPGIGPVVQLIAVDKTSGDIAWRIFGPREPDTTTTDFGNLLLRGRSIIWQVANSIYALDSVLGQIQWRHYIAEQLPMDYPHEEAQMAETTGVLLVARSDVYHALDLVTGNERWTIANPGNGQVQASGGVVAGSNEFFIYGGRTLKAIDLTDQHTIWSQKQLEAIQNLKLSDDGTMIYAILVNTLPGSPTTQVLAAFDVKTGAVRWTFQPFEQERFINAQSDGFQYSKSTLYAAICFPANQTLCDHEVLYAINAITGAEQWKFEASSIYDIHLSASGDMIAFQTNSSAWENLIERFRS